MINAKGSYRKAPRCRRMHAWLPLFFMFSVISFSPSTILASFEIKSTIPIEVFNALKFYSGGDYRYAGHPFSEDGMTLVLSISDGTDDKAYRWTASGGLTFLGDLAGGRVQSTATGISQDGSAIVGRSWSSYSASDAYRWTEANKMVRLGNLPTGTGQSTAHSISGNGGVIVGYFTLPNGGGNRAFSWKSDVGYLSLGQLNPNGSSTATDTSEDGSVVVGYALSNTVSSDGYYRNEAFRWTAEDGMIGLGDLWGYYFSSEAKAVSADGNVIVGWSSTLSTCGGTCSRQTQHAFRWTEEQGMVDLGWIPGSSDYSNAFAVSADGSAIIGKSGSTSGYFIWSEELGISDFANYLKANTDFDPTGWKLIPMAIIGGAGNFTMVGIGQQGTSNPVLWHLGLGGEIVIDVPAGVTEGDDILIGQGSVSLAAEADEDIVIALASNNPEEIQVPASVLISAGQLEAVFDITVMDDALIDGTQSVVVTAIASGFSPGEATLLINDNESAVIDLSIPVSAAEGSGLLSQSGRVLLDRIVDRNVTVTLASNRVNEVTVPASVVIPSGSNQALFDITIMDDARIDGAQPATITASVAGWTSSNAIIEVTDNETNNLVIGVPGSANEGYGVLLSQGQVSISGTLEQDLTVQLASSNPSKISVPSAVTIPSGQTSAQFSLTALDDTLMDGRVVIVVTASASGFVSHSDDIIFFENDVHHLTFNPVSDGQAGVAFSITITAKDINDAVVLPFYSAVTLEAVGVNGPIGITPMQTGNFLNGVWSGSVSLNRADSGVTLTARGADGQTGVSNAFILSPAPLNSFIFDLIPSPQTTGVPFDIIITAKDAFGATVTDFSGVVNLSAGGSIGEKLIGTGTSVWSYPLYTYYHDARTQVIYTAGEIGGARKITGLALDVTKLPGQILNRWTIRMKHTSLSNYSGTRIWENAWSTVYQGNVTISKLGWVEFVFPTPFQYNGAQNLMIDFSFNNSSYTSYGSSRYTYNSQTRALYAFTDSGYGDPLNWGSGTSTAPTPYVSNNVPNIKLKIEGGPSISPVVSGNFIDGIWTGEVTVNGIATGLSLKADDGQNHIGTSNSFDTK